MNVEDFIKDLTPELQEKARACGSVGELLALAKDAQVPLPDEALAAIAGGDDQPDPENCKRKNKCPKCGSKDITYEGADGVYWKYKCNKCGHRWEESHEYL